MSIDLRRMAAVILLVLLLPLRGDSRSAVLAPFPTPPKETTASPPETYGDIHWYSP